MILYGSSFSPFVLRVRLVARSKGHDLPFELPPGEGRAAEYRALNPLGKVPCLIDNDLVLPESEVIANYLDDILDGPRLWPVDPRARAVEARIVKIADHYLAGGLHRMIIARMGGVADVAALDQHRATVEQGFRALDHFRDPAHRWLAGDHFGHGDALLLPIFEMAAFFEAYTSFSGLIAPWPALERYFQRARDDAPLSDLLADQRAGLADFAQRRNLDLGVMDGSIS
jgi:glutathione S-transferase